jgi:hypothetical protein
VGLAHCGWQRRLSGDRSRKSNDLELSLQAIQALAVVFGIAFGLIQLSQLKHQREVQAGLQLLAPLQTQDVTEALLASIACPTAYQVESCASDSRRTLPVRHSNVGRFESLGPVVARGHVPIDMYAEFYRGPTVLCWAQIPRSHRGERLQGGPTLFEWLQWLAERMEERSLPSPDLPAFTRFADWKE